MKVATPLIKSTLGADVLPCFSNLPNPLASCRLTEPVASLSRLPLASTACTVKLLALPLTTWAGARIWKVVAPTLPLSWRDSDGLLLLNWDPSDSRMICWSGFSDRLTRLAPPNTLPLAYQASKL